MKARPLVAAIAMAYGFVRPAVLGSPIVYARLALLRSLER